MLPVVHIYIDRSEAETWNHDEIDNLQGKINTGEYSMSKVIIIGGGAAGMMAPPSERTGRRHRRPEGGGPYRHLMKR